jgi:S-(hydroxymethyl)glutathione dehydrogenase/alcohol dehydrogenase
MTAVVYVGKKVEVQTVPKPEINDQRDVIVKISACPICGSDEHLQSGGIVHTPKGEILGHEAVGVIEQVGSEVSKF